MGDFSKLLMIGKAADGAVWVRVAHKGGRLSFVGVVGPKKNGDARGGSGQIGRPDGIAPADGWTADGIARLWELWDRWHLNDMRAGSPAQEAHLRANPVSAAYPVSHYAAACAALAAAGLNPDAGYSYGHAWNREEVPADVLAELSALPDAAGPCPWGKF